MRCTKSGFFKNAIGSVALSAIAALMIALAGGGAEAQDGSNLQAVQGDVPAADATPAVSKLEVYSSPVAPSAKTATSSSATKDQVAAALAAAVPSGFTVIAPTFLGANQNYSYFRFPNGGAGAATFNVTLIGSPTAHAYGTVSVTVAHFASPQYSILDFFKVLGVTSLAQGDTGVSLYLQSPQAGNYVGFQHVVWNSVTGFFENASVCTFKQGVDYSGLNQSVFNVHTSTIQGYPGVVYLHNFAASEVIYRGNVFDAADGTNLGAFSMTAPPNATVSLDVSSIETMIGFHPSQSQYHVNVQFQPPTGVQWNALVSVAINDQQLQAYTNMSLVCSVNP